MVTSKSIASDSYTSELTSPSTLLSESSHWTDHDQHTMTGGAVSLPSVASVNTAGSPTSVLHISGSTASDAESCLSFRSTEPELARIKLLEQKRLVLRHQRFSLEQRLYEFCGKYSEGILPTIPSRHVVDMPWRCKTSGIKVVYSGPLNARDEPHGKDGIMRFSDGQVYRGDIRHGYRYGAGTNSWPDGQDYTGEWKKNSRSGRGTHSWPDGRKVTGEWKEGHLNGKVYFSWPNGATYDGLCRMGKKHGRGLHTWSDGRAYTGNYENGKEHGFGTLTHPDGVKYRGQFHVGIKQGYGIMLWSTRTYDGEWAKNKPHGQGRVVWSNGATYTGQFQEGKYHGLGVYIWPSGKKFVGRWECGVKNGHGLYTWPNGQKYDGEYKLGLKDGYGRMTWADGQTYCGGFKNNMREGRGVQTGSDGKVLHCGLWKGDFPVDENGNPVGQLEEFRRDGVPRNVTVEKATAASLSKKLKQEVMRRRPGSDASLKSQFEDSTAPLQLPERDISSPEMIASIDDDDDDESQSTISVMVYNEDGVVQTLAPTRLVV